MKISPEDQEVLRRLSRKYLGELTRLSREDNQKSLDLIREAGIKFTHIKDDNKKSYFYESGKKARRLLIGKLYDEDFLNKVEGKLTDFKAKNEKK